jgi:TetR/AcrR family transcriptional regulator, transcriptional repressor for nem operon
VPYSKAHTAQTRAKILKAACRCFRERGLHGVSIADIMTAANLTHGGFYGHFSSKDALVREVVGHAMDETRQYIEKWAASARDGESALNVIVNNYLSVGHRDNDGEGCPVPLLGADIGRSRAAIRAALTVKLKSLIGLLGGFGPSSGRETQDVAAIGLLAALVGGMLLARATNDRDYSDWILEACRGFLIDALPKPKRRRPSRAPRRATARARRAEPSPNVC